MPRWLTPYESALPVRFPFKNKNNFSITLLISNQVKMTSYVCMLKQEILWLIRFCKPFLPVFNRTLTSLWKKILHSIKIHQNGTLNFRTVAICTGIWCWNVDWIISFSYLQIIFILQFTVLKISICIISCCSVDESKSTCYNS